MADVLDARLAFLNDCMKKLPTGDRKLLRLRYADGATTKRVADSLGRSVQAIYRALVRVHEALFRCIDQSMKEDGRR